MTENQIVNCGWHGTIHSFLLTSQSLWQQSLIDHHTASIHKSPPDYYIAAWNTRFHILQEQFASLTQMSPEANTWHIIFEYELPRERGRHPNTIVLTPQSIFVLAFTKDSSIPQGRVDQAATYKRDLQHYHTASHHREVHAILVATQTQTIDTQRNNVWVVSPGTLAPKLLSLRSPTSPETSPLDPERWLQADYSPLPSLVNAARALFKNEPLPDIRKAKSAGIPDAIAALVAISEQAYHNSELHLALLTGVPGSGKTLVGLQFVYEHHLDALKVQKAAVFLSGNGPLVDVLQYALKSSVFVQDVHGFLKQYGGLQPKGVPTEHIWVYDEAQRAWDAKRVEERRGQGISEPEDFLRIGERMQSWALLVGLIGEGQEIHLGEEAGIEQWNTAIKAMNHPWIVHCPPKLAPIFLSAAQVRENSHLDLTISLRTHIAEDVQKWVAYLLSGQVEKAIAISQGIYDQGFDMYITQDLEEAKSYVKMRYQTQGDKRYGLLASSRAKNLPKFGIANGYESTHKMPIGPWYYNPPESPDSCCQLRSVATEFACQGLELDFPIVCWGNDFVWEASHWKSLAHVQARDPHLLRLNSYRVLLSRGRDGFVVFVPPESDLTSTFNLLRRAGLKLLQETGEV